MSIKQFPESQFPTIHCTKLIVHPTTTDLKWNTKKKHPGIDILGRVDTAKSLVAQGYRGVLAADGYTVGIESSTWYFVINESVSMYFGLAVLDQDLASIDGVAVKQLIDVNQTDRVRVCLTTGSTVSIKRENMSGRVLRKYIIDVSQYNNQILYPWVSTQPQETMSVKIMQNVDFGINVRTDGLVRMNGSKNDIVDFSLNDINTNNDIPVERDSITNTVSGAYVQATDDGEIKLNGGIEFKCENITTSTTKYVLSKNQNVVMITNSSIDNVHLPEAVDSCRSYTIIRNYNLQPGEVWQDPVLKIIPYPGDTIELESMIGLPPHTNVELLSDSVNDWRII